MTASRGTLGLLVGLLGLACGDGGDGACSPGQAGCECLQGICAAGSVCGPGNLCVPPGGDGDGDGDGDSSSGACELLLACVEDATPENFTDAKAEYGPGGTCWDQPGISAEDCDIECRGAMKLIRDAHPDVTSCWECDSSADCSSMGWGPTCNDSHACGPKCSAGEPGCSCSNGNCEEGECVNTDIGTRCLVGLEAELMGPGGWCSDDMCDPGCVCVPADDHVHRYCVLP